MPYESKAQQRLFHAKEARGEISHRTVHEFDEATKGHYGDLPMHKGAKHNDKYDFGNAGSKRTESPEKATHEVTEKENSRGGAESPPAKSAKEGKGKAMSSMKGTPGGGDVSGNQHKGMSAVEGTKAKAGHFGEGHEQNAIDSEDHPHGEVDSGPVAAGHIHHHEDIHIHLGPGIANEGTQAMHMNQHSGFGRPPMNPSGAVPMYSASQQGVTMNDSHVESSSTNAQSHRGAAAPGKVHHKSNPVRKGRG